MSITNVLAQVGINTDQPLSDLDIKGGTRVTGHILTGGDDNTKGAPGTKNMLLISQGQGFAPLWKEVSGFEIIKDEKWYLVGTLSQIDTDGGIALSYPKYETGVDVYDTQYKVTQSSSDQYDWGYNNGYEVYSWREFKNMNFTILASDKQMRVMLSIQLPIQAFWKKTTNLTYENWISGAFGVFKQGSSTKELTLVASTQGGAFGVGENNAPTRTFTLIVAVDIPPSTTDSKFRLLGTRRNVSLADYTTTNSSILYMGADKDGSLSSRSEFNRLTLKIDIFAQTKK